MPIAKVSEPGSSTTVFVRRAAMPCPIASTTSKLARSMSVNEYGCFMYMARFGLILCRYNIGRKSKYYYFFWALRYWVEINRSPNVVLTKCVHANVDH